MIVIAALLVVVPIAWLLAVSNASAGASADEGGSQPGPSPSVRPSWRFIGLVAGGAVVGFCVAWGVVDLLAVSGVYGDSGYALTTASYQLTAAAVLAGQFPYRDFAFEYPPLSLASFIVPLLVSQGATGIGAYGVAFQSLMLLCGIVMTLLVVNIVSALGGGRRDLVISAAIVAASPLLVGPVILSRFDLWPAVLVAASLAAILKNRYRIGFAILALGILAKVYPAVLVPVLVVHVWRQRGGREAARCLLVLAAVTALGLAPFLLLAASGTITALTNFVQRPLEIETLGAVLLVLAHDAMGYPIRMVWTFGSHNLAGGLPDALALTQSVLLLAVLLMAWIGFARGPADRRAMTVAVAASLCAYVALGKVLSPQYLIWLIPVVAVLQGTGGRVAIAALAAILLLTGIEFPGLYADYAYRFEAGPAVLVLVRDLGLCMLAGFLVAQVINLRRLPAAP